MVWPGLDEKKAKRVDCDGYVVYMFFPHAVRYEQPDRTLTLSSEPLLDEDERGKRGWLRGIYLPSTLRWDDGVVVSPAESKLILDRLSSALRKKSEHYKFVYRDDVYSISG